MMRVDLLIKEYVAPDRLNTSLANAGISDLVTVRVRYIDYPSTYFKTQITLRAEYLAPERVLASHLAVSLRLHVATTMPAESELVGVLLVARPDGKLFVAEEEVDAEGNDGAFDPDTSRWMPFLPP